MTNHPTKPDLPTHLISKGINIAAHPFVGDHPDVIAAIENYNSAAKDFDEAEALVDELLARHAELRTEESRNLDDLADELGAVERKISIASERFVVAARKQAVVGALVKTANRDALAAPETADKRRRILDEVRPEILRDLDDLARQVNSKIATLDEMDRWLVDSVDAELSQLSRNVTTAPGGERSNASRIAFRQSFPAFLDELRTWPVGLTYAAERSISEVEPFNKLRWMRYAPDELPAPVRDHLARRLPRRIAEKWLAPDQPEPKPATNTASKGAKKTRKKEVA